MSFPIIINQYLRARDQAVPPEISARLNLLTSLADSLAKTSGSPGDRRRCRIPAPLAGSPPLKCSLPSSTCRPWSRTSPTSLNKVSLRHRRRHLSLRCRPGHAGSGGRGRGPGRQYLPVQLFLSDPALSQDYRRTAAPLSLFSAQSGLDNRQFGAACVADPAVQVLFYFRRRRGGPAL